MATVLCTGVCVVRALPSARVSRWGNCNRAATDRAGRLRAGDGACSRPHGVAWPAVGLRGKLARRGPGWARAPRPAPRHLAGTGRLCMRAVVFKATREVAVED